MWDGCNKLKVKYLTTKIGTQYPLKPEQLNVIFLRNFLQRARSTFESFSIFFFWFFFFNSSTPSDPYFRSAALDATIVAVSSTPSISNLKNKFATNILPKLFHFSPPLILVLLQLLCFL
jgi:hypothetical protein